MERLARRSEDARLISLETGWESRPWAAGNSRTRADTGAAAGKSC